MKLQAFCNRLDDVLETKTFTDIDGSPNGLQVGRTSDAELETVGFAVDAAQATIEAAAETGVDILVTHHGLWWKGTERLTGRTFDRVSSLIDANVALYVSHLPLDSHGQYGNAARIAAHLDLASIAPFGTHGPVTIGQCGTFEKPQPLQTFIETVEETIGDEGESIQALQFGPDNIERVAIVTGSGGDWLDEAVEIGADVLLTGEGKQRLYHEAREENITVILAGHYATEIFGVRALADLVSTWDLETRFFSHPTGL